MDELELDLDGIEAQTDQKLKVKNRFQQLSEKVKVTSQEKDEITAAKQKIEAENALISKERDFYKGFSTNISKYPNATQFQDKILEKVKAGYDMEDAMVAVLNKEGKLTAQPPEPKPAPQVEGGSAPTATIGNSEPKTMDEKRKALMDADRRGELESILRGGR